MPCSRVPLQVFFEGLATASSFETGSNCEVLEGRGAQLHVPKGEPQLHVPKGNYRDGESQLHVFSRQIATACPQGESQMHFFPKPGRSRKFLVVFATASPQDV